MPPTTAAHHRRSIRLRGYDYRQPAAYFITLVTLERKCIFGEIVEEQVRSNPLGQMAANVWCRLPERFPFLSLDEWVVMPNHLHGIIFVDGRGAAGSMKDLNTVGVPLRPYDPGLHVDSRSLGAVIRVYKSSVTLRFNRTRSANGKALWQRNYYEHIIRNDWDLERVREYIQDNPKNWSKDNENPIFAHKQP